MSRLKTADFDYELPVSFIAQKPAPSREGSRLMVWRAGGGAAVSDIFARIGDHLSDGTLLVLNDTRVFPARLTGRNPATGGRVEILLVREREAGCWECLLRPGARTGKGARIAFEGSALSATVSGRLPRGGFAVRFDGVADFRGEVERIGRTPLPPYIKRAPGSDITGRAEAEDRERYQTVYARRWGAVAAPTAGLHFSRRLIERLKARGITTAALTLHVGPGTFRPVAAERLEEHRMDPEWYEIGEEAAGEINRARREGRPVVAVGTTVARALETAADDRGLVASGSGWTDIFIHPPYRFKAVENLLTNFHLPRSTLLMLVAALAGRETVLAMYEEAKREGFRFYSYGDAMLILNAG